MRVNASLLFLLLLQGPVSAEQRNVVLISIDTIRADYLSCNGSSPVSTPNLDRIASRGANFLRARAPVPLTLPSHASLLTGLLPPSHGVRDNGTFRLAEQHLTLPEVFAGRGYQTAAFVGSFVLDHRFGLDQGFHAYDDRVSSSPSLLEKQESERSADAVWAVTRTWLSKRDRSKAYFIWIHLYDPHAPYLPPEPYKSRHPRNPYAGEVAYTDAVIGKFLELVEWDQTILAVVGDHGEGLGQHQEDTHSVLIYNSTLRVPMILAAPGLISPGQQIHNLVRTIDLAPTILDYAGVSGPFGEGISLRGMIEKKETPEITSYSESLYPKFNLGWSSLIGMEADSHHLIDAPKPELYDVIHDPEERNNLYAKLPELAAQLRQMLRKHAGKSAAPAEVDPETLEKLRSLGYVSGSHSAPSAGDVDPKDKMKVWNEVQAGLLQFGKGEHEGAAKTFDSILKSEKDLLLAYDYLGSAYMQLEEWELAEKCYRAALSRRIEWSGLHMNLGLIHQRRNQLDQAQREFEKAIVLDKLNVTAYFHLASLFRSRKQFEKAIENYRSALQINPLYVYALNGIGMSYAAAGRNDEALEAFQEMVKLDPAGYYNLGAQLERMSRPDEALDAYRKCVKLATAREAERQRQQSAEAIRRLMDARP